MCSPTNSVRSLKQKLTVANDWQLEWAVSLSDELLAVASAQHIHVLAWNSLVWKERSRLSDTGPKDQQPYAVTLSGVPMEAMPDPDIPPTVSQIEESKECSVAATGMPAISHCRF